MDPVRFTPHPLEEKLLKRAKDNITGFFSSGLPSSPEELKEKLQSIVYTHISLTKSSDLVLVNMSEDLKSKTLGEIYQKYVVKKIGSHPLVEVLRSFSDKINFVVDQEKITLSKKIRTQFEWAALRRDEMIRILIEQEAIKSGGFDCVVMDISELPLYLDKFESEKGIETRRQILVCNEVHYTAVDLLASNKGSSCAVLDAYGENKKDQVIHCFQKKGFQVFTAKTDQNIQIDQRSCSLFSLDHVVHSHRDPYFFSRLQQISQEETALGLSFFSWSDLPKEYIKNSQNPAVLIDYLQKKRESSNDESYFAGKSIEAKLGAYVRKTDLFLQCNSFETIATICTSSPL